MKSWIITNEILKHEQIIEVNLMPASFLHYSPVCTSLPLTIAPNMAMVLVNWWKLLEFLFRSSVFSKLCRNKQTKFVPSEAKIVIAKYFEQNLSLQKIVNGSVIRSNDWKLDYNVFSRKRLSAQLNCLKLSSIDIIRESSNYRKSY